MDSPQDAPLIIGFVADLIFASRIQSVAEGLNYRIEWIEQASQIGTAGDVASIDSELLHYQLAEHLIGPGGALLEHLTQLQPALLLFDLGNAQIPWREWITLVKTAPATRRIPVICYGSHVDVDTLAVARNTGAEAVLARSRFITALPELIRKYARVPDYAAFVSGCTEPLSELALEGLEAFNRGEYFEAHELLEAAWNADATPTRELYRAVLQVAVAYLQITRGNYKGAAKMFLRVRQWIEPLPDECRGIAVEQLRQDAGKVRQALLALGPKRLDQFDLELLRPVRYHR